jgi:hypothetical protein
MSKRNVATTDRANRTENRADIFRPFLQPSANGHVIYWLTRAEFAHMCEGMDKRHMKDLGDCALYLIGGYAYLDVRDMTTNAAIAKANAAGWNGIKF